jgi:hypothetical protein
LIFASKLVLDEHLFDKMNAYVDLIQQIDQALSPESTIRQLPGYQELKRHKKIDSFLVFTSTTPEATSGASDFSQAAIERRIAAGYHDALIQLEEFSRGSPQRQQAGVATSRSLSRCCCGDYFLHLHRNKETDR